MPTCVVCGGPRSERSKGLCRVCYRTQSSTVFLQNPLLGFGTIAAEKMRHCCHHWCIDTPQGPTSMGICIHCGDHQEFQNSIDPNVFTLRPKTANRIT